MTTGFARVPLWRTIGACLALFTLPAPAWAAASTCSPSAKVQAATPEQVRTFFKSSGMIVLTFLGYSGAGYEDPVRMLAQAGEVLDGFDPERVIVNIGATGEGIGGIYALAKARGFITTGIVSTQAREYRVPLARCVDIVFFIEDEAWGGFLPGTERLSPTSAAMVEASDVLVAIGGGEVARDELIAARRAGKSVEFIPADMNHRIALERALKRSQPPPTDFRGAAAQAFPRPRAEPN
jgi:hypothetical protein